MGKLYILDDYDNNWYWWRAAGRLLLGKTGGDSALTNMH